MKTKYQYFVDEALVRRSHAASFPVDVGSYGFTAASVHCFLQVIDRKLSHLKKMTKEIVNMRTEISSRRLWLTRDGRWNPSARKTGPVPVVRLRNQTIAILRYLLKTW